MNKYIKSFCVLGLGLCLYTCQLATFADYTIISSEDYTQQLAPGIEYRHKVDFTNKGFININVLKMNYDDPNVQLDLLKSEESISKRETLTQFAKEEATLYGAVNGDFFDYNARTALGPVIEEGIIYASPINDPEFSSFNITRDGVFFIKNWSQTYFRLKKEGFTLPLDYVNKPYFYGNKAILFNSNWSNLTLGNNHTTDILEMLVIDDKIKEMTLNGGPKIIPENGYVIAAVGDKINILKDNFSIGDDVTFVEDGSLNALDFSIGGGTRLLKNSAVVDDFTLSVTGRHPRTALAYTANNEILLVTVDGRSTSYPGVTQLELANILLDLGATNAINLDGGGSTTMIKKNLQTASLDVVNAPSDGQQRRVQNAVGFKGSYPIGLPAYLELSTAYPRVFINNSMALTAITYDENNNKLTETAPQANEIQWTVVTGQGYFENNLYYPTTPGIHKLKATYGDASGQIDLRVLENLAALSISPNKLSLKPGQTVNLTAQGISSDGYSAPLDIETINWTTNGNTGTLTEDGVFTANTNPGSGIIRASFDNLESYIPVAIGTDTRLIHDFEKQLGSFVSYPNQVTGNYTNPQLGKNGSIAGQLDFDFKSTEATRAAYIDFGNALILNEIPNKLSLDVFGNKGNNHWLRARIKDSQGATTTVNFDQNVNWTGWKTVEAKLPSNLKAPITLERIYLVETDPLIKDSGSIIIDDLYGVFQPTVSNNVPKNIDRIAHIEEFMLTGQGNYVITSDSFGFDQLSKEEISGTTVLKLNNKNKSIRKNDYTQWISLLDTCKESTSNPLLLIMASTLEFVDPLEKDLFYKSLEKIAEKRNIAVVYPDMTSCYKMQCGIEFIGLNTLNETTQKNNLALHLSNTLSFELQKQGSETAQTTTN